MKIIDAHSHISYISHDFQSEIIGTIVCTTNESEWDNLINILYNDKNVFGAFGIHPWFADSVDIQFESRLEFLLKNNPTYMIGEIGLDKNKPNMKNQIDIFQKQFDIAVKLKRIVFIHCVGAWDKILYILKQYKKSSLPIMIFHSFNGNNDIIKYLIKNYANNIYFSFGKNVLYGRNYGITQIPENKILVETDGKQDVLLKDVLDKICQIKNNLNMPDIIYNNTQRVLKNE